MTCYLLNIVFILCLCRVSHSGVPSTCKKPGLVVLSFDQGPGATTGKVLDILSRRNIPAIFHVSPELFRNGTWRGYIQRAANEGHSIGIFVPDIGSDNFVDTKSMDIVDHGDVLCQSLVKASNWISSITGRPPQHVRFGRKIIPSDVRKLTESMGLLVTRPRIEIRDESNKMDVIWNSINRAFNGSDPAQHSFIVKLRDIMPNMAASLDKFIDYIDSKGFRIVPMELCQPIPDRLVHFKSNILLNNSPGYPDRISSSHAAHPKYKPNTFKALLLAASVLVLIVT